MISSLTSIYMDDYKWPYIRSQTYRSDGGCYYHPLSYHPMDYDSHDFQKDDFTKSCRIHEASDNLPYKQYFREETKTNPLSVNQFNPYNDLHCFCHECLRRKNCRDTRHDLQERYPYIYKPEDHHLTNLNDLLARFNKDRFRSVYQRDYCEQYGSPLYEDYYKKDHERADDDCFPLEESPNRTYSLYPNKITKQGHSQILRSGSKNKDNDAESFIKSRQWQTEYMDGIGRTGNRIMKEKLHENWPVRPPKPSKFWLA